MNQDTDTFFELLAEGEPCTFQTFDDTKAKRKELSKILHGKLADQAKKLEILNQSGAGVFVMVNAGDGKGRKTKNVLRVRAAFVDLDGSPVEPVIEAPLPPHIIVESSKKRFHAYWLIDGILKQEFRAVQEMLALKFEGDLVVKDLPRVMRLPGFMHQKNEPYLTNILHTNEQKKFKRIDFFDAFNFDPSVINWQDKLPIHKGQRNNKLFSMACGFVSKGYGYKSISERIYKINEERCKPLLPNIEIEQLVQQAMNYGANGELRIDYKLIDSPAYKALSPRAKVLDMAARRNANGNPETSFPLLTDDLEPWGFQNPKTLAKYRGELLEHGFLHQVRSPQYGKNGETRECGLYELGEPDLYSKTYHKKP